MACLSVSCRSIGPPWPRTLTKDSRAIINGIGRRNESCLGERHDACQDDGGHDPWSI